MKAIRYVHYGVTEDGKRRLVNTVEQLAERHGWDTRHAGVVITRLRAKAPERLAEATAGPLDGKKVAYWQVEIDALIKELRQGRGSNLRGPRATARPA